MCMGTCPYYCCCGDNRQEPIVIGALNYDGMDDGLHNFQLSNLLMEFSDDGTTVVFSRFEGVHVSSASTSIAFMPPVVCRISEVQRPVDENVSFVVPVDQHMSAIVSEARRCASSCMNMFHEVPTVFLVFRDKKNRTSLRVALACENCFLQSIPVGTELRDGRSKWLSKQSTWGQSVTSMFAAAES